MDTTNYVYNGKKYKPSPTVLDSNTFFHAAFGIRIAKGDAYLDKKVKFRRMRWASFLAYFEDEAMPPPLKDALNKCLTANNKYKHSSVEDQDCLEYYISDITKAEQSITVEEIPVLASLENIKIVLFVNGRPDPLVINPNMGILGSYSSNEQFKGEVILCLGGNLFSRLNPIEEGFSRSLEDAVAEVKQGEATTAPRFNTGSTKYKKAGSAGSEGVQFQVDLLTIFFLNALRKLSNWRLSTENTAAGKFDDAVLEWPEGATLLQAKHKQSKTKKITLEDLTSVNSKNDDFSLPKYFLSFEQVKRAFPLKNLIICTNASVDGKAMRFLEAQDVPFESPLHWKDYECKFYTFNDDLLPYLKEGVKSYHEKNSRDKNVDESKITDENMKDFQRSLLFYSDYPAGNGIRKVTEDLLSNLKSSKNPYGAMTPFEVHTKIMEWFQQKEGVYLTELSAKGIFSEICTDRVWQSLGRHDVFFRENLTFQTSNRIFHVITENGLHLLQELRIFRALQQDKTKILYIKADDDIVAQKQTIEAFLLPKYTILVIVWPEIVEDSIKEEVNRKLGPILTEFTYKKVILVADRSNTLINPCGIIIEPVSFDDLAKESQKTLLEKECILFQGTDVTLGELLATQAAADYRHFLDTEILEKLIRSKKIEVGSPPSDLTDDIARCYISRKFEKASTSAICEEAICESNQSVILISDHAGAGKSTVLTSLAVKIKKYNPQLWVLRIDLNNYTQVLRKYLNTRKKTIHIVDLLNSKRSTKLTNRLEKSVFSMKAKVVLMLDGFDEVGPDFTQLVLSLMSVCRRQRNFDKLIVTTRPHMALELESTLQVESFALEPLEQQSQTDFLTRYWVYNLDVSSTEKLKCERYAEALMSRMTSWMKSDQKMPNTFTAIPLHIRMMAEIFQDRDPLEDSADWEGCKEFLTANRLEPKLPDNMNVTRLYKMFVEKKRSVFFDKGNPTGNTAANQALINLFEECLACHRNLALELIFEEEQYKLFSCYRQPLESLGTSVLKIGIVQKLGPFPLFVHRTFAEYFVAERLVEELKLSNRNENFQKLLIEDILVELSFNEVRVFFDGFLQYVVDKLPSTPFQEYQASSYALSTNRRQLNLLHNLAEKGYVAILKLILNCMDSSCMGSDCVESEFFVRVGAHFNSHFQERQPEQFNSNVLNFLHASMHLNGLNVTNIYTNSTLLECASMYGNSEMVKFLVNQGADVNAGQFKLPIHLAVLGGYFEVVKFLTEQGAEFKTNDSLPSPVYLAIQRNYKDIAAYILERMLERAASETKDPLIAYAAAYLGRADVLEEQVRRGLDINSRVDEEETVIFGATRGEQLEIIRYLVRQGCDVNAKDSDENTALMMPIQSSTAEVLAELGIDVNSENLYGETALNNAVMGNNFELVEVLVRNGADVNSNDDIGRTSLHVALESLLPRQGSVNNGSSGHCTTRLEIVKLLMEHGADANIQDQDGRAPFHWTVVLGELDAVVLLMEYKVDVNVRDQEGRTGLDVAVQEGYADISEFLVQNTCIRDNSGRIIVHMLASFTNNLYSGGDWLDVLRLVQNSGGEFNTRDNRGRTALHRATETDFIDVVVYLVESGVDLNVRDEDGNAALHLAVHPKTVEYLVRSGADVTARNNCGHTALHLAAKKDHSNNGEDEKASDEGGEKEYDGEENKTDEEHQKRSDEESEKESDEDYEKGAVTSGTTTPPSLAEVDNMVKFFAYSKDTKRRSYVTIANILVSHSVSVVDIKDETGSTAVHLAAVVGNREMVQFLVENDADVQVRDCRGRTALHVAAERGQLDVVELLLDFGVDFTARDNEGCTALEVAARKGCLDVVNLLIAHEAAVNQNCFFA